MRDKKAANPKPKEISKTEVKRRVKEIKKTVEKKEAEKINTIYEEVVVEPKLKAAAPKSVAAQPAFKDILDVKTYYKTKYRNKYGVSKAPPPPPEPEYEEPEYDQRELLRQAMNSVRFF